MADRRPRVVFIGNTRYDLPLPSGLARKWDAVADVVDLRVLATGGTAQADDPRFVLVSPGRLPFVLRSLPQLLSLLRGFGPDVIVTQSAYEGAVVEVLRKVLRRRRPRLIVEVHGDWRSATRTYGSSYRRLASPSADAAARWALRRADGVRALSAWTAGLAEEVTGRPPTSAFPTYFDARAFAEPPVVPVPERPRVLWVGALQSVKGVEVLGPVWERVARAVPEATLHIVGDGHLRDRVDAMVADGDGRVRHDPRLSPDEVAAAFDEATVLFLPSRSEGLGRVVLEAFLRSRPVVASAVGGILDVVAPGRTGLLRPVDDVAGFAEDLATLLKDPELARRLGRAGHAEVVASDSLGPERYAQHVRRMVDLVLDSRP